VRERSTLTTVCICCRLCAPRDAQPRGIAFVEHGTRRALPARMRGSLIVVLLAGSAQAMEAGLSGPSLWNGDADAAVAAAVAIEQTGASWARINFRLDLWSAPDDATLRGPQQLTYFQAYDRVVDELTQHGVRIYALINSESVPGGNDPDSDAFVDAYTKAALQIVDHFKDRVRVFELFNEPNNWRAGTQQPAISPYYLAKLLQSTYLAVKHDGGRNQDACDQVTLVSGALFSFDGTDASDYLTQLFQAGRSQLAWDWMHANAGGYPLDGLGYHLYTSQPSGMQANLDGIWSAFASLDDAAAQKSIWISEFGWPVDQVSAQTQGDYLTAGFDALGADAHVAAALWFTYQDFPGGLYGLYTQSGLATADRRQPAYDAFTAAAAKWLPSLGARFAADSTPMTMTAGDTASITISVANLGSDTWTRAQSIRLGAGASCPSAAAANQLAITPGAAGGYTNSLTDVRLELDPAASIATGASAQFTFAIAAPAVPGRYTLALRMVRDGVAWFGDTLERSITVVAQSTPPAPSDGSGAAGSGDPASPGGSGTNPPASPQAGGCTVTGDSAIGFSLLAGIFLIALSLRRRT